MCLLPAILNFRLVGSMVLGNAVKPCLLIAVTLYLEAHQKKTPLIALAGLLFEKALRWNLDDDAKSQVASTKNFILA